MFARQSSRRRPSVPGLVLALLIGLAAAVPASAQPAEDARAIGTYKISKVFGARTRSVIAATGADIFEVGRDYVLVRATPGEAMTASAAPEVDLPSASAAPQVTLLSASFDTDSDGFAYEDDAFGTSQPSYASGTWVASAGFGATGGLQVTLGGVDADPVSGMSGGWSTTLNLAANESGVTLSFRYKLDQSATYAYDEYTRMLVKVDGVQHGRGSKTYVDHIGGDGASTLGNSSTFLPTTDWQQHQVFVGDLAAGTHTIVLGGYNNKKDAADESSTATIDDVLVTSGSSAPAVSDRQAIVNRLSSAQFASDLQGLTSFGDRCRLSSCPGSPANSFFDAQAWVASQLTAMGYTVEYHTSTLNGGVSNLYVAKLGAVDPDQMYIVSAHLDGRGGGAGYDDDGSGSALLLTAAQVFAGSDIETDKSVRFIWWDKEEGGLLGSGAYVQERRSLQGTPGEPTWLGVIQHDMILYDHGAGTASASQSPYADLDVEWRAGTAAASQSRALALKWRFLNGTYSTQYPATAYDFSTNTDDTPFQPYVASVSVRENRRSLSSGGNAEWINPNYHTAADVASSYSALDLDLGFNAVQGTVGTVAELVNARLVSPNLPPSADAQSVTTAEDVALGVTLTGSDPDGDPLTFAVVNAPAHGTLSGTAPDLTYNPAANYNGPDSFSFKANDGRVDSAPAAISVSVTPVNDPPVADAQAVATTQDLPRAIVLTGSDVDGDALTFSVVTQPGHGTLTGTAPNLTYSPAAGYVGADSFSFTVNDGTVDSPPATVSITMLASTPTTTTLSSSPNPSTFGQSVTFTATVTSGAGVPVGTVTFTEGATVWASGVAVNGAGQAAFSTAALAVGSHTLTAAFTGAAGWGNSSGNNGGAPQVVNPAPTTVTFTSVAAQDGWVLESGETTNVGGSINATASTTSALRVGDDNADRQYKSVVSFDTSSIPDGATIVSATLRLRRGTLSGSNPFTTHGTCWVDVQTGGLSGSTTVQTGDFQAAATAVHATSLSNAASNGIWSEGSLNAAGLLAVNKTGTTQLRVYFNLDDNDDLGNDYIGYYSGDNTTAANRPQLVVTYQ